MKNIITILIVLLSPFFMFGQSTTLSGGAVITVGNDNISLTTYPSFQTGDISLTGSGTKIQLYGSTVIASTITLNSAAQIKLENNSRTGSNLKGSYLDLTNGNDNISNIDNWGPITMNAGTDLRIFTFCKVNAGVISTNNTTSDITVFSYLPGDGSLICKGTSTKGIIKRKVKGGEWNQIAPSVEGVLSGDYIQSNDTWFLKYNESTGTEGDWEYIIVENEDVKPGEGRSVYKASDKVLTFEGTIRTTDLANSAAGFQLNFTDVNHGYNLIGNPFTSALLWDGSADWGIYHLSNAIWIWDGSQYISSPGGLTSHNIALGQGFFVRATDVNPAIILPASKRVHVADTYAKKNKNSGRNYLTINANNNDKKDVAYIYFDAMGSDDYEDGYDAYKMIGSDDAPQLYTVQNGVDYTYNFLATLSSGDDKIVSLNYIPGLDGDQKISLDFSNLTNTEVFLEDLITGETYNMNDNPEYSFKGSKSDRKDRFVLHFTRETLSDVNEAISNIKIFTVGNILNITSSNKAINNEGTVTIYDISGRQVIMRNISASKNVQIPVNITKGTYIVKVDKGEFTKVEKIQIN